MTRSRSDRQRSKCRGRAAGVVYITIWLEFRKYLMMLMLVLLLFNTLLILYVANYCFSVAPRSPFGHLFSRCFVCCCLGFNCAQGVASPSVMCSSNSLGAQCTLFLCREDETAIGNRREKARFSLACWPFGLLGRLPTRIQTYTCPYRHAPHRLPMG